MSSRIAGTMSRRSAIRAREPDLVGLASHGGVRVAYESFGQGGVNYRPVSDGGAPRAAALIAPLLAGGHSGEV